MGDELGRISKFMERYSAMSREDFESSLRRISEILGKKAAHALDAKDADTLRSTQEYLAFQEMLYHFSQALLIAEKIQEIARYESPDDPDPGDGQTN